MNLLAAALYDPAVAVSKATSSLLAMTAFDTTNLSLAVTVPAHGMLRVRICCTITGATTVPTIFLGVLNHSGGAVLGRCNPQDFPGTMNAATQNCPAVADFIITGLTPGALTLDAAYGVEVIVAATNIKYGGPNDTTTNNAWGAFQFEIWDPQPMTKALDGAVNVKQWNGTNVATPATAGIPDVNVKNMNNVSASPITTVKAVQGLTTADTIATYTGNTPQTGDNYARIGAPAGASVSADIAAAKADTAAVKLKTDNLPASPASTTNITAGTITTTTNLTNLPSIPANWLTAAGINAGALNGKGDWNIGKTGYALSAAGIQAIWDALTSALTAVGSIGKKLADWTIGTAQTGDAYARLGSPAGASVSADIAAVKTDSAAIKLKTDNLPASPAAVGSAMTLTSGERTAIANEVETQIIDETDSEKVLTAITDKIAAVNPDLGGLTVNAIASGVRTNLATELGRIDVAVSTRGTGAALDAAGIRSAVGLATANLDTQIGDVPTNAELSAALDAADDAVLTAIGDVPTNAELATALAGADDAVLSALAPVSTKVDELHKIQGLDAANPMTVTPNTRIAGAVNLAISGDGETTSTVTRS